MIGHKMLFLMMTFLFVSATSSAKALELEYASDYIKYVLDGEYTNREKFEEHCSVKRTQESGLNTVMYCEIKFSEKEIALNKRRAEQSLKEERQREEIYDNCIFDKMPKDSDSPAIASTFRICERISKNPSWWHKFWYSD